VQLRLTVIWSVLLFVKLLRYRMTIDDHKEGEGARHPVYPSWVGEKGILPI